MGLSLSRGRMRYLSLFSWISFLIFVDRTALRQPTRRQPGRTGKSSRASTRPTPCLYRDQWECSKRSRTSRRTRCRSTSGRSTRRNQVVTRKETFRREIASIQTPSRYHSETDSARKATRQTEWARDRDHKIRSFHRTNHQRRYATRVLFCSTPL